MLLNAGADVHARDAGPDFLDAGPRAMHQRCTPIHFVLSSQDRPGEDSGGTEIGSAPAPPAGAPDDREAVAKVLLGAGADPDVVAVRPFGGRAGMGREAHPAVLEARGPWSPATHRLFPRASRRRAAAVLRAGHALEARGLLDFRAIFLAHVLPLAIAREPACGGDARAVLVELLTEPLVDVTSKVFCFVAAIFAGKGAVGEGYRRRARDDWSLESRTPSRRRRAAAPHRGWSNAAEAASLDSLVPPAVLQQACDNVGARRPRLRGPQRCCRPKSGTGCCSRDTRRAARRAWCRLRAPRDPRTRVKTMADANPHGDSRVAPEPPPGMARRGGVRNEKRKDRPEGGGRESSREAKKPKPIAGDTGPERTVRNPLIARGGVVSTTHLPRRASMRAGQGPRRLGRGADAHDAPADALAPAAAHEDPVAAGASVRESPGFLGFGRSRRRSGRHVVNKRRFLMQF